MSNSADGYARTIVTVLQLYQCHTSDALTGGAAEAGMSWCALRKSQSLSITQQSPTATAVTSLGGSSCRVHYTPKLTDNDVGVLTLGQFALEIPPGEHRQQSNRHFVSSASGMNLITNFCVFFLIGWT